MSKLDYAIDKLYMQWIENLIFEPGRSCSKEIMQLLYATPFTYTIPMDGNRYEDGVRLRYDFGRERGYSDVIIAQALDMRPCSVLEMMVALALRCGYSIMDNPVAGPRVGRWFWTMMESLGINRYTNVRDASDILQKFLDRNYQRNGKGGLFTLSMPSSDLRSIEIWNQMMWFLDELIGKGEEL